MPNLEQTGQLLLTYAGVDELAADEAKWAGFGQPLAGATAETRRLLMQTLLDEMRRNICIESSYLTEDRYEDIKRASQEWLRAPWALTDEQGVVCGDLLPRPTAQGNTGNRPGPLPLRAGPVRALAAPTRPVPPARPPAQRPDADRHHRYSAHA